MANQVALTLTEEFPLPRTRGISREAKAGLRGNMRLSIKEGSGFSLMVGVGETYLPAFLLWMGLGSVFSGWITTLPIMAGSLVQLFAPYFLQKMGSYKRWVLFSTSLQGLAFLPLVIAAITGKLPAWLPFVTASIYWAGGLGASGAWNAWMGTLIPSRVQVGFFTFRTRVTQAMVFLGFVIGGLVLHYLPMVADKKWAFVTLFTAAMGFRMYSVSRLRRQSEPRPPTPGATRPLRMRDFARRLDRNHEQGRLFTYLLSVTFTAQLASPFFTAFMLGQLKLPYSTYAILVAASYLGKVLFLPLMGKIAVARGTRPVLILGGLGIITLPALWLISQNFYYLFAIQALSGIVWGAFELASLLLIWELVRAEDRPCAMSAFNLCNASAMTLGSILGGWILTHAGGGAQAFAWVFGVSTLARAMTLVWLKDVSHHRLHWMPVGFRTLAIRPTLGILAQPIFRTFRRRR
ncbi:MFS transporter [bacterium]|nr:MFS transporter [bacterium]